jgi:dipeptidyl aminopeptidase/acylaminoacyl peptidase
MKITIKILIISLSIILTSFVAQEPSMELAAKIEAMAKVGACYSPSFSPDGSEIAFISNISGTPQLWKIPSTGGWPIQLTNFNDPVSNATWAPNRDKIAFQIAPGGGMNSQLYIINSDGTGLERFTSGGKTNNWIGVWSEDGSYLSYSSNKENPAGMDCYFYDPQNGTSELIVSNQGIGVITDIAKNNSQSLLDRLVSRGSNDVYLIDKDKNEKLLTEHTGPGTFFGQFSSKGDIYMASNLDRDLIAFGRVEGDKINILKERDNSELEDFIINKAGNLALLVWNTGGKNQVSLFDLQNEKEVRLLDLPVELIGVGGISSDDHYFVFTGNGSTEPSNIWIYDLQNNDFKKLTESPHPGINLKELITPELVKFESFDGLELSGWLYKPPNGTEPYPTVISYHGGPEDQSRPYFSYTFQAILSQGIAVFSPNVRGSSGFGKKFVNLDNGPLRANGIKDIKACYDYIVNSGFSQGNKIGIMGGSYGGYMVMAGITEYPEMFAAAANLFGVVNFKTFFDNTEPWMAAISKVEYGDPDTEGDMLKELSPIHKVDLVITPTIVLHGANDTNVPVVEAEQVVENLKKRSIPVEYVLFPDEGHGWRKTSNKVTSTFAIVNWFNKYLYVE